MILDKLFSLRVSQTLETVVLSLQFSLEGLECFDGVLLDLLSLLL